MGVINARAPRGQRDEIDEVVGSAVYAYPHYDTALRNALLGVHATTWVPVSRFYLRRDPPLVVDFEPTPGEGRFFEQEKRAHFTARGIVYVPVRLGEILTREAFAARVADETKIMEEALRLQDVRPGEQVPEHILTAARAEAARQCQQLLKNGRLAAGVAYDTKLTALTRALIAELTALDADGRMGSDLRSGDTALAAR